MYICEIHSFSPGILKIKTWIGLSSFTVLPRAGKTTLPKYQRNILMRSRVIVSTETDHSQQNTGTRRMSDSPKISKNGVQNGKWTEIEEIFWISFSRGFSERNTKFSQIARLFSLKIPGVPRGCREQKSTGITVLKTWLPTFLKVSLSRDTLNF